MRRFDLTISQNLARGAVVMALCWIQYAFLLSFDPGFWVALGVSLIVGGAAMWWAMEHLHVRDRAMYECEFVSDEYRIVVSADAPNAEAEAVIMHLVEYLTGEGHNVTLVGGRK